MLEYSQTLTSKHKPEGSALMNEKAVHFNSIDKTSIPR